MAWAVATALSAVRQLPLRGLSRSLVLVFAGLVLAAPAQSADTLPREIEQQFRRGDTGPAMQRLDDVLVQQPGDAGLRFLKAVLLSELARPAEATALLERLTQDFPELPEPYNNLAVLQASAGRLDQARLLLESALRLDPAYRTAHENLGDVYVRLALRAYQAATGPRTEPSLQTKLRQARELAAVR